MTCPVAHLSVLKDILTIKIVLIYSTVRLNYWTGMAYRILSYSVILMNAMLQWLGYDPFYLCRIYYNVRYNLQFAIGNVIVF